MRLQIKQLYIDKRTYVWTITCQRLTTKAVKYALKGHGFGEIWNKIQNRVLMAKIYLTTINNHKTNMTDNSEQ